MTIDIRVVEVCIKPSVLSIGRFVESNSFRGILQLKCLKHVLEAIIYSVIRSHRYRCIYCVVIHRCSNSSTFRFWTIKPFDHIPL